MQQVLWWLCAAQTLLHADQFVSMYPACIPSLPAYSGGYGQFAVANIHVCFKLLGLRTYVEALLFCCCTFFYRTSYFQHCGAAPPPIKRYQRLNVKFWLRHFFHLLLILQGVKKSNTCSLFWTALAFEKLWFREVAYCKLCNVYSSAQLTLRMRTVLKLPLKNGLANLSHR